MKIKCPYCGKLLHYKVFDRNDFFDCSSCIWYDNTSKIRIGRLNTYYNYYFVIDEYVIYADFPGNKITINTKNNLSYLFEIKYIPINLDNLNETISLIKDKISKLKTFI